MEGKSMFRKLILIIFILFYSSMSYGKTIEIDMLNKLGKEKMVYSIKVAKIELNDKIIWKHVSKGHNVEFIGMPKGVKKFKTKINKKAEYEFKKPGIYLYQCTPHKAMGMIGIVVVGGDKSNLEKIKKVKLYGKSKKIFKKLLKEL
jgi:pseudoazurin